MPFFKFKTERIYMYIKYQFLKNLFMCHPHNFFLFRLHENFLVWCVKFLTTSILKAIALELKPLAKNEDFVLSFQTLLEMSHHRRQEMEQIWKHERYIAQLYPRRKVPMEVGHIFLLLKEMQQRSRCCQRWWCPNYRLHWPDPNDQDGRHCCFTINGLICHLENHGANNGALKLFELESRIRRAFYLRNVGQLAKDFVNNFLATLNLRTPRPSKIRPSSCTFLRFISSCLCWKQLLS